MLYRHMIRIDIEGAVQGVGFRPTVYRAATNAALTGAVANAVDGVHIYLYASRPEAERLVKSIRRLLPPAARIDRVTFAECERFPDDVPTDRFAILHSDNSGSRPTDVSPDIAICADCLDDIRRHPRRIGYPLTNCTNCGPRFSIIRALPYDRASTSMALFDMCGDCSREYHDPLDRRFHAQPVCCNRCGPVYDHDDPAGLCARLLAGGEPVIIKGIGGYNLLCDARRADTVARLRRIKSRPRKPFAVMMPSLGTARAYVDLSADEQATLASWRAPIVIACRKGMPLPSVLAPGCHTLGVMLPYMGLHHMIARLLPDMPLVVTSVNLPGHPIITDDDAARDYGRRHGITVVGYNRAIVNRLDDSVVRHAGGRTLIYRRSRGYVPEPLHTAVSCDGLIGTGADITSQWAFGRGSDIIQSPYIGSLDGGGGEDALRESIDRLLSLYRVVPRRIVVDAHPRYVSSDIGRQLASRTGASVSAMWHHHAHAVSVMADRGLSGTELALVLDGTGAGPDGTVWGSELIECTPVDFEPVAHGCALAMPGGDAASREPWRMAVSALLAVDGSLQRLPAALRSEVGDEAVRIVAAMVSRGVNSPASRGAGRLWDAVSALLGVAYRNGYEAEAPILLEQLGRSAWPASHYPLDPNDPLSARSLLGGVIADIAAGADPAVVAARFHATYATAWAGVIVAEARRRGRTRLLCSGGVMQNALLVEALDGLLSDQGIELVLPTGTPVNDACIAVGQVYHAAARRSMHNA